MCLATFLLIHNLQKNIDGENFVSIKITSQYQTWLSSKHGSPLESCLKCPSKDIRIVKLR